MLLLTGVITTIKFHLTTLIAITTTPHQRRAARYVSSIKVPAINIKGRWFDEAGFAIGAKVKLRVCQGCLVMTVEE